MSKTTKVEQGKKLVSKLADICRELEDKHIGELFSGRTIEELLMAILDPMTVKHYENYAEFFLANKTRSSFLAGLRLHITRHYSFEGKTKDGRKGYVSPIEAQWFDDGVMLLEGKERFAGLIALYRGGKTTYAVAARDAQEGDKLGPDDFLFVSPDDPKFGAKLPEPDKLDVPVHELEELLRTRQSDESKYQELFAANPWVFGLQYKSIQRHEALDNENIPDFTGVRVRDSCWDIIELKPPTMRVFRPDGEFTADFNAAWNQTERYLNLAREDKDYLKRKGLRFDNPIALLICGYDLPKEHVKKIRIKERMNPAICLRTFNDMLVFMRSTVKFIKDHAV